MNDSILSPHYTITPTTNNYLDDLDRQRWLIDNLLLMPKHEAWIRREIQVRRAVGTTRIEGATLDEDAVRGLEGLGSGSRGTEDERANINALQAYEFIDFLSDQPDIFGHVRMGRTRPLAVDHLVKVIGVGDVSRFHSSTAPSLFCDSSTQSDPLWGGSIAGSTGK
ncbi:MAG: hypothetical protein IIA78_06150 [Proteobacteria bacterium]|nr:hypothetical protein [Pseudomonadota bacterium]